MADKRTTDARPGTAWDDWHSAGYEHVAKGATCDMALAADAYAVSRGSPFDNVLCNAGRTCRRAFLTGARQAIKHMEKSRV